MTEKNDHRPSGSPAAAQPKAQPGLVKFGIVMLGVWLIISSIGRTAELLDFSRYRILYETNPAIFVRVWRVVSLGMGLLGMIIGLGFFFRREIFRKGAMLITCIATVLSYWRHPQEGFVKYIQAQSEQMAARGSPYSPESVLQFARTWQINWLTEDAFAWGCVLFVTLFEVLMAGAVLFFLTRASVKAAFREKYPKP